MKVPYVDLGAQYSDHRDEILDSIDNVLKSGHYILGPELQRFESSFAELCGVRHAIGVADGTAALSLIMKVYGIGNGDEVITCPNSFFSSASSIVHTGATPVFCDVKDDQLMDPVDLEKRITKNTKAIMPVHLTGKTCDMDSINEIAKKYNLKVIEDSAQAVGAIYKGKKAGSLGHSASFSLHPLKNLNGAGDGGMITTNDDEFAEKIRLMRNHGMVDRDTIPFWGYNCRLDEIQAAVLNVKMKYLDQVTQKRRENANVYREVLQDLVEVPMDDNDCLDVYHLFVIQCDRRDELKSFLQEKEVYSSIHYPVPIHLFECSKTYGYKEGDFPNVERQSKRILSLPIHQNLSIHQIEYTAKCIKEFYN